MSLPMKPGDRVRLSHDGVVISSEGNLLLLMLDGDTKARWFSRDRLTGWEPVEGPQDIGPGREMVGL